MEAEVEPLLQVFKCFGISSRDEENVRTRNKLGRTGKWVESLIVMSGLVMSGLSFSTVAS